MKKQRILIMLSILFLIFVFLFMAISVKKSFTDNARNKELETVESKIDTDNGLAGEEAIYDISKYIDVDSADYRLKDAAGAFCDFFSRCLKSGDFDSLSDMVNYDFIKSYSSCELDKEGMKKGILEVCTPSDAEFCLSNAVLLTDVTNYADGILIINTGYTKGNIDTEAIRYKDGTNFNVLFFLDDEGNIKSFVLREWLEGKMGSVDTINRGY